MPNPVRIRTAPAPLGLSVAAAALLVAATLAMPRVTYAAEMTHSPAMQTQTAPSQPAATKPVAHNMRARMSPESVDQRISSLKSKLKITAKEEGDWNHVASAMRANAKKMRSLIEEVRSQKASGRTAVQDLKTYQRFAEAHEQGLRKLTAAFTRLYDAMPAAQKKNTDQVFNSWQQRHSANQSGEQQQHPRTGQHG